MSVGRAGSSDYLAKYPLSLSLPCANRLTLKRTLLHIVTINFGCPADRATRQEDSCFFGSRRTKYYLLTSGLLVQI